MEEEWKTTPKYVSRTGKFERSCVGLEYGPSPRGWKIQHLSHPCSVSDCQISLQIFLISYMQFSEEEVKFSKRDQMSEYDYPPRLKFDVKPSQDAQDCELEMELRGFAHCGTDLKFYIPLEGVYTFWARWPFLQCSGNMISYY